MLLLSHCHFERKKNPNAHLLVLLLTAATPPARPGHQWRCAVTASARLPRSGSGRQHQVPSLQAKAVCLSFAAHALTRLRSSWTQRHCDVPAWGAQWCILNLRGEFLMLFEEAWVWLPSPSNLFA